MRTLSRIIAICAILIPLVGCDTVVGSPTLAAEQPSVAIAEVIENELRQSPTPTLVAATPTEAIELAVSSELSDHDDATVILFGDDVIVDGPGVTVNGSIVTISAGGSYVLRGSFTGQVVVDYPEKDPVELLLDGVSITSESGSSIAILDAKDAAIVLMDGTDNLLVDGEGYVFADGQDEPNATLYSKSDLVIGGTGSLIIEANYEHGINGKDDLVIAGGTITVSAVGDGIRGKDSLVIADGVVSVTAGQDGLKSNNDEDADKGVVTVQAGSLTIEAGQDGIQGETSVTIAGGYIDITTGGGAGDVVRASGWGGRQPVASTSDETSAKAIKAGAQVQIDGGQITVDSLDDAVHSNDSLTISDGTLLLKTGDDGIHADANLTIAGGDITITQSYEGIESAVIAIQGGSIHVVASDDGINVAGGADGSAMGGRPGQNSFASTGNDRVDITGGYIVIDSQGDGLDANGAASMSGGVLVISGPTSSGNGALDVDRGFVVTGGVIIAAGSSGMAQATHQSSTQNTIMVNLDSMMPAGEIVTIATLDGETLLAYQPPKAYQSVVISAPELEQGQTYTISTGAVASGEVADGVYTGGISASGAEVGSVTIDAPVSYLGTGGGMGFGGQRGMAPAGGQPGAAPGGVPGSRQRPPGR